MTTAPPMNLTFSRPPSHLRSSLLSQTAQAEKRIFPTHEAFDFASELRKRTTTLLCAYDADSGELYGYVVYVRTKRLTRIQKAAVSERWRRRGVAEWMVRRTVEELERSGAREVDLWVDPCREAAVGLYMKLGFVERERVEGYYRIGRDGVRMVLAVENV